MDFISAPVISGFCTAAAVTVILSQFKTILGLTFRGSTFTKVLPGIFKYWRTIRVWDAVLGFAFIAFLLLLKVSGLKRFPFWINHLTNDFGAINKFCVLCIWFVVQNLTLIKKWFNSGCCLHRPCVEKALWFVSTCRNALAVILGCLIAYIFEIYGQRPFQLLGEYLVFFCLLKHTVKISPAGCWQYLIAKQQAKSSAAFQISKFRHSLSNDPTRNSRHPTGRTVILAIKPHMKLWRFPKS